MIVTGQTTPAPHDPAATEAARVIDASVLPLRRSDFEALLAQLYHRAIGGEAPDSLRAAFCRKLAELLSLPLVVLGRALEGGAVMIEGASNEGALWLEFQRIPERWDDGIASHGPAGVALATRAIAHLKSDDDGLSLWRNGALKDLVTDALALPLPGEPRRVLELFWGRRIPEGARTGTLTAAALAERTALFFADLESLSKSLLAARALRASGAAAFITDLDATIVWCNPAFLALSGYPAADVIGRKPSMLRSGVQGLRYYRELWDTIRSGKTWTSETVDRNREGEEYSILQSVSPVPTDGRVTHYVSIHHDISRLRRQRARLQAANRQDPETGLLTRAAFEANASAVLQAGVEATTPAVLVLASLRGLREATRTLPPEREAKVLAEVGRRLRAAAPWLTGALGAYEYVMLMPDEEARSETALQTRLTAVAAQFEPPLEVDGQVLPFELRFGSAHCPADGASLRPLMDRADRRLADQPFHRARRRVDGDPSHEA